MPVKRRRFSPAKLLAKILANLASAEIDTLSAEAKRHVIKRSPVKGKYKLTEIWMLYEVSFEPIGLELTDKLIQAFAKAVSHTHRRESVFKGELASVSDSGKIEASQWISISAHQKFPIARQHAEFFARNMVQQSANNYKQGGLTINAWKAFSLDCREPVLAERKHAKKIRKRKKRVKRNRKKKPKNRG